MYKREKLIRFYKETGLYETIRMLGHKLPQKARSRFERILVNSRVSLPRRSRFREDWISFTLGILNNDISGGYGSILDEQEIEVIVSAAEVICEKRFSYLGTGQVQFPNSIPWHTDIISGYVWPMDYFADIAADIGSAAYFERGCDIKYPWELSRLQFLVTLGQAYRLTGEQRYFDIFRTQIMDWIERNPVKLGCNWACTMDVAIRGANLCAAAVLFQERIIKEPGFSKILYEQLLHTGRFIVRNLECDLHGHGNNHYLSNLAGLLFLGLSIRKTAPEGERWLNFALSGLEGEIQWQVNEDGGSFEGSLSYHRLSTEIFLTCAIVSQQNGQCLSKQFMRRLEKMCQFIYDYLKPDGKAPVLGDADDGRFLVLDGYGNSDIRDHRSILGTAGWFFRRSDFITGAGACFMDAKWFFGANAPAISTVNSDNKLVVYPETGIVRYLWDGFYILIKCGSVGTKGIGAHDHNDQMSFELNICGCDIIIDSGSYTYTRSRNLRQQYRSTSSHNVSQYEDNEQNIIRNVSVNDLFRMYSSNNGILLKAEETASGFIFAGKMKQGESEAVLIRTITLDTKCRVLQIEDVLQDSRPDAKLRTRLHLSPKIEEPVLNDTIATIGTRTGNVIIEASDTILMEPCSISPSYGVARKSRLLQWTSVNRSLTLINY